MKTVSYAAFLTLFTSFAAAQERLTAAEIAEALTGNTAIGEYQGTAFRQYFHNDGSTLFRREGQGRPDVGKWRTTDENEYCAWWATSGWSCYWMSRVGDKVTWHYQDEVAYPATLVTGARMDF
ncbi:MAG: hypothetical protein RIM84_09735 [Alphaproteobacteria bacterium]